MVFIRGLLAFALLALWIYCVVDVLTRTRAEFRTLPKYGWLPIVVLLPGVGSLLWLLTGRPTADERPATPRADDDEAYLRRLRERAEQQRRAAERQKRRLAEDDDA